MKDFAKSIVCNTKAGNSNKAEIIEKKKKEGATLKVDNGQKLEFSDGSTYVKTSFSDDYREAHNYTGNTKVGNADVYSGNYIIMGDDGDVWFRDEHEDVSIKNIDSWAQKKIAEYQRSIDEIKKGVQEAKQQAKKFGLI